MKTTLRIIGVISTIFILIIVGKNIAADYDKINKVKKIPPSERPYQSREVLDQFTTILLYIDFISVLESVDIPKKINNRTLKNTLQCLALSSNCVLVDYYKDFVMGEIHQSTVENKMKEIELLKSLNNFSMHDSLVEKNSVAYKQMEKRINDIADSSDINVIGRRFFTIEDEDTVFFRSSKNLFDFHEVYNLYLKSKSSDKKLILIGFRESTPFTTSHVAVALITDKMQKELEKYLKLEKYCLQIWESNFK